MDSSIGKALRDARLEKKISLEEAAGLTKIRPDRLEELERDEYGGFPSLAYARNFLLLYAKFLGVDVSKYPLIDVGKPVLVGDYQYLKGEGITGLRSTTLRKKKPVRRSRWLIVFGILAVATTLGALTALFILNVQRLPSFNQLLNHDEDENTEAAQPSPTATPESTPEATPAATPAPSEAPASPATPISAEPPLEVPGASLMGSTGLESATAGNLALNLEASDRNLLATGPEEGLGLASQVAPEAPDMPPDAIDGAAAETSPASEMAAPVPTSTSTSTSTPAHTGTPATTPTPAPPKAEEQREREIKVRATRRTRVRIIRDVKGSTPVYDDWLEPGKLLSLRGKHFWIESRNPGALKVTSDDQPVDARDTSSAAGASGAARQGIEVR